MHFLRRSKMPGKAAGMLIGKAIHCLRWTGRAMWKAIGSRKMDKEGSDLNILTMRSNALHHFSTIATRAQGTAQNLDAQPPGSNILNLLLHQKQDCFYSTQSLPSSRLCRSQCSGMPSAWKEIQQTASCVVCSILQSHCFRRDWMLQFQLMGVSSPMASPAPLKTDWKEFSSHQSHSCQPPLCTWMQGGVPKSLTH